MLFLPNGIGSLTVIRKLAKKEFGYDISECKTYLQLKNCICNTMKKMTKNELEENRLDTLVGIKHLEENDFGNFVSVRLAYWGMLIAIAVAIIGEVPIYAYFNMTRRTFVEVVCFFLILLLITMSRTIHYQHDQLEYLNFKLLCFEELAKDKKGR